MRKNLEKFPRSPIWRQDDWERTPLRFFKRRQKELGKLSQKLLLLQTSIDISKFSAGVLGSGMVYGIWWNQDIIIHSVNLASFLLPPKWIHFSRSLVWALDFLRKTGNQRFQYYHNKAIPISRITHQWCPYQTLFTNAGVSLDAIRHMLNLTAVSIRDFMCFQLS